MPSKPAPPNNSNDTKKRCPWPGSDPLYRAYHDEEWGVPAHDDRRIFEFLILEVMQAGLSWITILRRRENYRKAFDNFDPEKIARYGGKKIEELMQDKGIIRNRQKIMAAVANAKGFLAVQKKFGGFDKYIWRFVGGRQKVSRWKNLSELPATSKEAEEMSIDLKRRGFKFVGPIICYAHMQATGMVNDHVVGCFRRMECMEKKK